MSSRKIAKRVLRAVSGHPTRQVMEAIAIVVGSAIAENARTPVERHTAAMDFAELVLAMANKHEAGNEKAEAERA